MGESSNLPTGRLLETPLDAVCLLANSGAALSIRKIAERQSCILFFLSSLAPDRKKFDKLSNEYVIFT